MSDWNAGAADYLTELARRPAALPPSTLGEIWDAEWKRSGLDTIGGIGQPFTEAYDDLAAAVEKHGGADLATLAYRNNVNIGAAVTPDRRIAVLNALADTLPEDAQKQIEPLRDVRRRAADKAQAIERNASDVEAGAYGLTGNATAFLAGTARQLADPINLMAQAVTAPIGGPFKGPILKVVARQAAAGGASQLLVEPQIQAGREELGLESGIKQGAFDVAQTALGAGGLAGLLRAGAAGYRAIRGSRAAAQSGAEAPKFEPSFLGYIDHEDAAALDRGEILPAQERPHSLADVAGVPGFASTLDIEAGANARPTRDKAPPYVPRPSDVNLNVLDEDHLATFDRGEPDHTRPLSADGVPDRAGNYDFRAGAEARPIRGKNPAEPLRQFEPEFRGVLDHEDAAALDRGGPQTTPHSLMDAGDGWRNFDGLSSADLDAAAHLVERDQLIDAAAPPHWDKTVHHAMVDEAAAALEAGRPIDRASAADRLEAVGLNRPALAPVETNAIADAAVATKSKRFGVHNMPNEKMSLFQFLASIGGLHPQDKVARDAAGALHAEALDRGGMTGDLKHILDGNPFVPGMGQLLRDTGMTLERARIAAAEQHYLPMDSKISDLLDMIREEASGNRQYRQGFTPAEKRNSAAEREQLATHRLALASDFDVRLAQLEITKVLKRDGTRALQIMEKEGIADPLLAYEQALAEYATRQENIRAKRLEDEKLRIPGWDLPDDPGTAPRPGADVPGQPGARSAEPGPGGEPRPGGEGARAQSEQGQLGPLGDPALKADADRAIAQSGGDNFQISIDGKRGTERELLLPAEEEASAAGELFDCIGVTPGTTEEPPF